MIYAPVLIPTLNRFEHFKETVTSLSQCTGAEYTDLYIALDYPPSEDYREGYDKIVSFLPEIEGFKTITILKRDYNYGIGGNPADALFNTIFPKYDRFIFSEDDNHFSPNFLEYMNKGFEKFKDDDSVIAMNGYRHFYDLKFGDNNYFYQTIDFSAWGYGMMTNKFLEIEKTLTKAYFRKKFLNPVNWWRVGRNGLNRFLQFFYFFVGTYDKPYINDGTLSVYMALNNKKVIMPSVSKVRNIGWDLAGHSFSEEGFDVDLASKYNNQEFDQKDTFEFTGDGNLYMREIREVYKRETHDRISFCTFFLIIAKKVIPGIVKKYNYHFK